MAPEEGRPGSDRVVILTHKLWERVRANPHIIGSSLQLDGQPYTAVGVFAPGLTDRGQGELTEPLAMRTEQFNHDFHWLAAWDVSRPASR